MTPEQLAEIERRHDNYTLSIRDTISLIAEVKRLHGNSIEDERHITRLRDALVYIAGSIGVRDHEKDIACRALEPSDE